MSSRSSRALPALALVAALVLVACGDGGDGSEPAPTATATATGAADAAQSVDLPDGVAAEVGDTEISADRVDQSVDKVLESPQVAAQLPEDEEQARDLVEASVLSQLILTEAIQIGAEDQGIDVSDEEIAAQRGELEEQAGGAEALQEQVATTGLSEDEYARTLAILDAVAEREAPDAGPSPSPAAPGQPDPADLAVQQWIQEQLRGMQIAVDSEYGSWDAQQLRVVPPPSAMQQPPAPAGEPTS